MESIAKRKAAFFGNICRGSDGKDIVTILEGNIGSIHSRGAQRRKWSDDIKDWLNITDHSSLKRMPEDRQDWRLCRLTAVALITLNESMNIYAIVSIV